MRVLRAIDNNADWQEVAVETFSALLDSLPDAVVIIGSSGKVVFVNRQSTVWFGYEKDELVGQDLEILIPKRFRKKHEEHRKNYIEKAPSPRPMGIGLELFGLKKDGTEFPVDISIAPVDIQGRKFYAAVIREITDRKQLESERDSAIAARESLLGMISHDLNNILTSIIMCTELAERNIPNQKSMGIVKSLLERIKHSGQLMKELVENVLALRKKEAKALVIEKTLCNISDLVEEAFRIMEPLAIRKSLQLEKFVPSFPVTAQCDRRSILQVLINLLSNSIKFCSSGGRIRILLDLRDHMVFVSVSDTGCGIAAESLPYIFDPYWQATRARNQGTGLGLSIVKHVVEVHGGKVWVESAEGKGSTFYFTLPANQTN